MSEDPRYRCLDWDFVETVDLSILSMVCIMYKDYILALLYYERFKQLLIFEGGRSASTSANCLQL